MGSQQPSSEDRAVQVSLEATDAKVDEWHPATSQVEKVADGPHLHWEMRDPNSQMGSGAVHHDDLRIECSHELQEKNEHDHHVDGNETDDDYHAGGNESDDCGVEASHRP
jgi:hypothetical protein